MTTSDVKLKQAVEQKCKPDQQGEKMHCAATKLEELLRRIENSTTTTTQIHLNKARNVHATVKSSTKWSKASTSIASPGVQ